MLGAIPTAATYQFEYFSDPACWFSLLFFGLSPGATSFAEDLIGRDLISRIFAMP